MPIKKEDLTFILTEKGLARPTLTMVAGHEDPSFRGNAAVIECISVYFTDLTHTIIAKFRILHAGIVDLSFSCIWSC